MQPPVGVPAKGGPATAALVTRPDEANVIVTRATPLGSPSRRHDDARLAAASRALRADSALKGVVATGSRFASRGALATGSLSCASFVAEPVASVRSTRGTAASLGSLSARSVASP
jgi:hypothetical protein